LEESAGFEELFGLEESLHFADVAVVVAGLVGSDAPGRHVGVVQLQVGVEVGAMVTAALVGPVGVIVIVGSVPDGDSLGTVDPLLVGVPDVLGVPLADVEVDADGSALGLVGGPVGVAVGVLVGVLGAVGVRLLVGSGIVGPPELSAGFGIRVPVGAGVGVDSGLVVVGSLVGLWLGLGVVGELVGLVVGLLVGRCAGADEL
jgi:hypothetical protein